MSHERITGTHWASLYFVSLLWGSSFLFFEIGLEGFDPLTLVFLRVGSGTVFLFLLLGNRLERLSALWAHKAKMILLGAAACALPFSCYAFGQQYVNSSTAGVINAMMPAFTFLFATMIGQERFDMRRMLGTVVGIVGVAVLLGPEGLGDDSLLLGAFVCLMATVFYGMYAVGAKRLARDIPPDHLTTGMVTWSSVLVLPAALTFEDLPPSPVNLDALGAALALGFLGTALAYKIFIKLISIIGATNASICTLLIPINAVLLGVVLLDESLDGWFFAGTVIIMASIFLIDSGTRQLLFGLVQRARAT